MIVRPAQLASSLPLAERLNIAKLGFWFLQRREDPDAFNDVNLQFISDSISLLHTLPSYGAERLFSILQIFLNSESGLPKVPATLEFLNHYFPMLVWGPCFGACMTRLKKRDFHTLLACKSDTIVTHSVSNVVPSYPTGLLTSYWLLPEDRNGGAENSANHCRVPKVCSRTYLRPCKAGRILPSGCCSPCSTRLGAVNDSGMGITALRFWGPPGSAGSQLL